MPPSRAIRTLTSRVIQLPLSIRIVLTLAFTGLIAAASLLPGQAEPGDSSFVWIVAETPKPLQKSLHVLLYAVLAMSWMWTLEALPRVPRLLVAAAVALVLGIAMEYAQTRIPGRYGTALDVGLNGAGILLGLLGAVFLL